MRCALSTRPLPRSRRNDSVSFRIAFAFTSMSWISADVGFSTSANESLDGLQEHVPGKEPSAVLLARVMIPVTLDRASPASVGPTLEPTQAVAVDQALRPLIYLPGKWLGLAPA